MDSPELTAPSADKLAQLPRPRPLFFKALTCFIVASLSLAWLASLQQSRVEQSRLLQLQPRPQPSTHAANPPQTQHVKLIEVPANKPTRTLTEADFSLAELDAIRLLLDTGNLAPNKTAANELRPYTFSTNSAVRDEALKLFDRVTGEHNKAAVATLSKSIDAAKELADKKNFVGAIENLQALQKSIPADERYGADGPDAIISALIEDYTTQRQQARTAALKGLEDGLRKKDPAAQARLEQALAHSDPAVRDEAKTIHEKIADEQDVAASAARSTERNAREEWVRFFKRFGGTVAEGDFAGASDLCETPPFDVILKGGVSDPNKVLRECSADVQAIQVLYDEALSDARGLRRSVSFHLRKGGQASGTLMGVNDKKLLRINPGKGAEIGIKISDLTSEGIKSLMDSGIKKKPAIRLSLATLEAFENPNDAEKIITEAYAKENTPLPLHWSERFRLEELVAKINNAEKRLAELKKAIDTGNGDDVKAALEQAKTVASELREMGGISEDTRKLLNTAETVAAKKQLSNITLQNGLSPDENYKGINTDQISEYRDSQRRTDVGVGYGLKIGASGGLQRALIKFDGLDAVVGNGRVRKATLELFQIDAPKSENASVGIFRVKRPWVPDSGSWIGYDSQKGHEWAIPGASGADDIEAREDSNIILDKKVNVWRQFDVTKFVQDIMSGKTQNNGLLLKVVNGEPDYHVRFYPESDLDRTKEKAHRPRLVLELARDTE